MGTLFWWLFGLAIVIWLIPTFAVLNKKHKSLKPEEKEDEV